MWLKKIEGAKCPWCGNVLSNHTKTQCSIGTRYCFSLMSSLFLEKCLTTTILLRFFKSVDKLSELAGRNTETQEDKYILTNGIL